MTVPYSSTLMNLEPVRGHHVRRLALCLALGTAMSPALSQQWVATVVPDSWYTDANWNPVALPTTGGNVFINNGGTALLNTTLSGGATTTPLLSSLNLGADFGSSNPAVGRVSSDGVAIQTNTLRAGFAGNGTTTFVEGVLGITGAGATVGSVDIGTLINRGVATQVRGDVDVGGSLSVIGFMQVGQVFGAQRGSQVDGLLRVGDLQGQLGGGFWIVGNVTGSDPAQVGSRASGEVVAGGSGTLTLAGGAITVIGTTFNTDRVVEAGTTFINQATGTVQLAGTLATAGNQGNLQVGRTFGGAVDGTLQVGSLAMGADRFSGVSVGTSTADGVARGRMSAGAGDLRHSGSLFVGMSTDGRGDGAIELGSGRLQASGSGGDNAFIGYGVGNAGKLVQAVGSVVAGGGFSGYQSYDVGVLFGSVADGSLAQGRLIGSADSGLAGTGNVNVGFLGNASGRATADGEMRMVGPLGMNGVLQVAQTFNSAAGSSARGVLQVGGDLGTVQGGFLIVGNVTSSTAAQVGSQSQGELLVGGSMTLAPGVITVIGTTFGPDRVVDGLGTRINQAQGQVTIAGTLSTAGDPGSLQVGRGGGGLVDGNLQVGNLAMGGNRFNGVSIGISTDGGATGLVEIHGGALRTTTVDVGRSNGGTAQGTLRLHNTGLQADTVTAGFGTGHGVIELSDSQAAVANDFTLQTGLLSLERSLLDVGNAFTLGSGAVLHLGIEGLARGTEFGAIDTLLALLDGELQLDFSNLDYMGADSLMFDLVRATDNIDDNFAMLNFFGLDAGYQASTGIFSVGDDEVYRLTLARLSVPEPSSVMLVLLALAAAGVVGRGTERGSRRRGSQTPA